jgi:hypothetical protein
MADPNSPKRRGNPALVKGGPSLNPAGRPPGTTITAQLDRLADKAAIARRLLEIIDDPKTSTRDRLNAIAIVQDRLEGKASQPVNINTTISPADRDEETALTKLTAEQLRRLRQIEIERDRILDSAPTTMTIEAASTEV